uniref:phosphoglycolate phosphatase n=3 Tax=unclassified Prevotella TaxID=2638335 RepID=A0AB33JD18_9BACT
MAQYKAYIFDLDGTLLDTLADLADSCNYALVSHGMPKRTIEEVRQFVGNGVRKLMERAVPGGDTNPAFDATYQTFREHYLIHNLDTTRPYPGVMEMLQRLQEEGAAMAVVSNKFYAATRELCKHFFGDYIKVAIGEREDIRKKPAPDTVMEALRQLEVGAEDAVYIGDSEVDVQTARNCSMPCISVLWGFRSKEFLSKNGAERFIQTPLEILC